jgi:hypothetical protein
MSCCWRLLSPAEAASTRPTSLSQAWSGHSLLQSRLRPLRRARISRNGWQSVTDSCRHFAGPQRPFGAHPRNLRSHQRTSTFGPLWTPISPVDHMQSDALCGVTAVVDEPTLGAWPREPAAIRTLRPGGLLPLISPAVRPAPNGYWLLSRGTQLAFLRHDRAAALFIFELMDFSLDARAE